MSNHLFHFTVINKNVLFLEYIIFMNPLFITSFISTGKSLVQLPLHYYCYIMFLPFAPKFSLEYSYIMTQFRQYHLFTNYTSIISEELPFGVGFYMVASLIIGKLLQLETFWTSLFHFFENLTLPITYTITSQDQNMSTPVMAEYRNSRHLNRKAGARLSEPQTLSKMQQQQPWISEYLQWTTLSRTMQVS